MNKDRSRTAKRTYLELKKANIDYIFWDIVKKTQAFSTTTKRNNLGTADKCNILKAKPNMNKIKEMLHHVPIDKNILYGNTKEMKRRTR